MKKHIAQTVMALLLLVSAFFLSKEGAQLANGTPKESKGVILSLIHIYPSAEILKRKMIIRIIILRTTWRDFLCGEF